MTPEHKAKMKAGRAAKRAQALATTEAVNQLAQTNPEIFDLPAETIQATPKEKKEIKPMATSDNDAETLTIAKQDRIDKFIRDILDEDATRGMFFERLKDEVQRREEATRETKAEIMGIFSDEAEPSKPAKAKPGPKPKAVTTAEAAPKRKQGRPPKDASESKPGTNESDVLAFVKKNKDGVKIGQIAKALGVENIKAKPHVEALLEASKIKKTGELNGTKYFPK